MESNQFLRDFFTQKYAEIIGNSDFYIAFEDCGYKVSRNNYQDLNGAYSPSIEIEDLSNISNHVIPICDTIIGHDLLSIDVQMQELHDGALFMDKKEYTDDERASRIAIFGNAKLDFEHKFHHLSANIRKDNVTSNGEIFYPNVFSPNSFLDETDWVGTYNEHWDFPSTATKNASGEQDNSKQLIWKIRPDLINSFSTAKIATPEVFNISPDILEKFKVNENLNKKFVPMNQAITKEVNPQAFFNVATIAFAETPKRQIKTMLAPTVVEFMPMRHFDPIEVSTRVEPMKTHIPIETTIPDQPQPVDNSSRYSKVLVNSDLFNNSIDLQRFVLSNDAVKKEDTPVQTNTIHIEFQYCIVDINRKTWMSTSLIDNSNLWYCVGKPEGGFSTGEKNESNRGKLPSLPNSMIVVKKLLITAAYNQVDWDNANKSVAVGCFNIAKSQFTPITNSDGTKSYIISSTDAQIIGWLCEYLPKMPLYPDPFL